jgi:hypothetical protein
MLEHRDFCHMPESFFLDSYKDRNDLIFKFSNFSASLISTFVTTTICHVLWNLTGFADWVHAA